MNDCLSVSLYFFDPNIVKDTIINGDNELKAKLDNYFLSNYSKINNEPYMYIYSMLMELYSKNHNSFINAIGFDLLTLCSHPPVTLFLTNLPKNTVLLDNDYGQMRLCDIYDIDIKKFPKNIYSSDMFSLLEYRDLDTLNLYKSKQYVPILQNLLHHPIQKINFVELIPTFPVYIYNIFHYEVARCNIEQEAKQIQNSRTDIEHYLDNLGLYESFKHDYHFITKEYIFNELKYLMQKIFPQDKASYYESQLLDYVILFFSQSNGGNKKTNNILHLQSSNSLSNNNTQLSILTQHFFQKYYKRTIFEQDCGYKHGDINSDSHAYQDVIKMIEQLQNGMVDLDQFNSSNFIGYIHQEDMENNTKPFHRFFVKPSCKSNIEPCLFVHDEHQKEQRNKTTDNYSHSNSNDDNFVELSQCNLALKTSSSNIKCSNKLEKYLNELAADEMNKFNSFVVSDFVNFKYEQRCFFKNGRIIGTTPCVRKISFLHCYPNGRIHPYFIDNHNADIDNLKLDRNMAAQMAWFVKAAAKDYDKLQLADGNTSSNRCGTIDVGYDVDKQEWKIIEIHLFEDDILSSNAGLYGMNPFLFNNRNIKEVNELNNGTLKINWRAQLESSVNSKVKKNALLIDFLEINDKYKIPVNNLLLMLPSKSLKYIAPFKDHDFDLCKRIADGFKSALMNSIQYNCMDAVEKMFLYRKNNKLDLSNLLIHLEQVVQYCKTERYFNEESNIDIACNEDKLSIKLSYGFIDISGFESDSTHLTIQSNFNNKEETKLFKIEPYQTHYQLIEQYLCDLILSNINIDELV